MLDSLEARNIVSSQGVRRSNSGQQASLKNAKAPLTLLHTVGDSYAPSKKAVKYHLEFKGKSVQKLDDSVEPLKTDQYNLVTETEKLYPNTLREALLSPSNQSIATIPLELSIKRPPLTVLDLSKNDLQKFPIELLQVSTLYILKLHHNQLESLPEEIYKLTDLETLNIGFNRIKSLPSTLSKLEKLKDLNLESNKLTSFGYEVTNLKALKYFNILNNHIEKFPTSFHKLEVLNHFNFEWFAYTEQILGKTQKGKDGHKVIEKLRKKCFELNRNFVPSVIFPEFLSLFSFSPNQDIDLAATTTDQGTLLHKACFSGDISVVLYLLIHHPDMIDVENEENLTPLCLCILQNNTQLAHILLQRGANPRKGGGVHGCPLIIAAKRANLTLIREILKLNEDPNRKDVNLNTALHHSVVLMAEGNQNAIRIARELLDFGANPNLKNREKWTPLHLAARKRSLNAVKWLLRYNLEIEEIHGTDEVFKINKKGGPYNWTPLHIAAYSSTPEIVEILAEAGANIFKRSLFGYCAKNGINKYGLTVKLCQKYESVWVKKHLFTRKRGDLEEVAHSNLKEVKENKYIRMASKNKFDEAIDLKRSKIYSKLTKKKPDSSIQSLDSINAGQFAPVWQNCQMDKIGEEDISDGVPQTETSFDHELGGRSTTPTEHAGGLQEFDEDLSGDALFANAVPFFGDKARLILKTPYTPGKSEKKVDSDFQISVQDYKESLSFEPNFDLEFCTKEANNLKETLLALEVDQVKRIRILSLLKALHEAILDYMIRSFPKVTSRERIMVDAYQEVLKKKAQPEAKSQKSQTLLFYNLVPEVLVSVFKSLNQLRRETIFLKTQICKMFGDFQYLVGLNFLQQIVSDQSENLFVRKEAQNSIKILSIICRGEKLS